MSEIEPWQIEDAVGSYDDAIAELRRRHLAGEPVAELPMFRPRLAAVAALYVETGGCYFGLPGCDPWDEARDARRYDGPWPVVAHPPCARWGRYWFGGPTWIAAGKPRKQIGDDGGCFAAALAAVRHFGGVLEHPEGSHAWRSFGLIAPPRNGGWVVADWQGGWTCCVEQGSYGHIGRKPTWLYAVACDLPSLKWGNCGATAKLDLGCRTKAERSRIIKTGIVQQMSKRKRAATPKPFRDLLISIARSARPAKRPPAMTPEIIEAFVSCKP